VGHRAYLFGKAQLNAIVPVFDDPLSGPIAGSQPRRIVLIGGAAQTRLIELDTRGIAVGSGLASVQSAIGTMIVYATQPDNVALDGDANQ
jgi:hypothetical protein